MPNEFPYDVFLSHSAKDKAVVRDVAERLRKDGVKVWFDEWVLKPGDTIPAKIEEGLERSRVLVLCMSANAFGSDWAQLEAWTFRFRDPLNKERRFLPLRLDDAPIKGSLAQLLYINWHSAEGPAALLTACHGDAQLSKQMAEVVEHLTTVTLSTKKGTPQWADHRELELGGRRLVRIMCEIETESPYFRFGFKLFAPNGRLFGDGSIQSQDANLVVHIARNAWDDPVSGITANDLFVTWYANGITLDDDKTLFSITRRFSARVELRIDKGNIADFRVNGRSCVERVIPAEIRRRIAVLAWADRNTCEIEVRNLSIATEVA